MVEKSLSDIHGLSTSILEFQQEEVIQFLKRKAYAEVKSLIE